MDRHSPLSSALLTPEEMGRADAQTIENGTSGFQLMEDAGRAVFDRVITAFAEAEKVRVLCGPGNNGGDGYIVAELLRQAGRQVKVSTLASPDTLSGDAALAHRQWRGETVPFHPGDLRETDLVIDALFGAGLSRPIEGPGEVLINAVNLDDVPVLSVDLPSGICGETGKVLGTAIAAVETVTFFRKKPGHLLNPGKSYCGHVTVADIGIDDSVLKNIDISTFENSPGLWRSSWPGYAPDGHKYLRGHAVVLSGGPLSTGASRLAARAALRVGAGLTSIAGSEASLLIHAVHLTSIMLKPVENAADLTSLLLDPRLNSVAAGPGFGTDEHARTLLDALLDTPVALSLDADALTLAADDPDAFFARLQARDRTTILTPHEGEFKRLFGAIDSDTSKLKIAIAAAKQSGAVVVLKGADTVIAEPGGKAAINGNAPPWLATAGSGDVLTGIITGLRAQGMPAFDAACAGVWLHGEAGKRCGPYLVADDLETGLAQVLDEDSHDWIDEIRWPE